MIPRIKPKIEISSTVVQETHIYSWNNLESLIEDMTHLLFKE